MLVTLGSHSVTKDSRRASLIRESTGCLARTSVDCTLKHISALLSTRNQLRILVELKSRHVLSYCVPYLPSHGRCLTLFSDVGIHGADYTRYCKCTLMNPTTLFLSTLYPYHFINSAHHGTAAILDCMCHQSYKILLNQPSFSTFNASTQVSGYQATESTPSLLPWLGLNFVSVSSSIHPSPAPDRGNRVFSMPGMSA